MSSGLPGGLYLAPLELPDLKRVYFYKYFAPLELGAERLPELATERRFTLFHGFSRLVQPWL
jgi:hypothetical protein